jgi:hypothetical protein
MKEVTHCRGQTPRPLQATPTKPTEARRRSTQAIDITVAVTVVTGLKEVIVLALALLLFLTLFLLLLLG